MSFILNTFSYYKTASYTHTLKRRIGTAPAALVAKASNKTISFMVGIEEGVFFVAGLHMVMKIPVMI